MGWHEITVAVILAALCLELLAAYTKMLDGMHTSTAAPEMGSECQVSSRTDEDVGDLDP